MRKSCFFLSDMRPRVEARQPVTLESIARGKMQATDRTLPADSPYNSSNSTSASSSPYRSFGESFKEDEATEDYSPAQRKTIQIIGRFTELYQPGASVMPSCHNGMMIIFAQRKSDNLDVVVKVRLRAQSFCDKDEEKMWRESCEIVLNLPSTEGIAQVYEILEDHWGYYVVMEKVPGLDLFEALAAQKTLAITEAKSVMKQILQALGSLHRHGLVHKDLKLENVMFNRSQSHRAKDVSVQVKLIDFDTVQYETGQRTKDVLGTNQYIAPESYSGVYSTASDIFAAGVIGYRLLTRKFPFRRNLFNDKAGENWVGSPKMAEIRQKLECFEIDWSCEIFQQEPLAKDLLLSMLSMCKLQRPSYEAALAHQWFADA